MPLLTDLLQDVLLPNAGLLTGAASLIYTGTITGTALAALFSRRPERRRAARDVLALLLRQPERPRETGRGDVERRPRRISGGAGRR